MTQTGLVFNIQRFSTHDGPGIRTTVFFKGCPLSCRWCANPESISGQPELMTRDIKCTGCGTCVEVCPEQAIRIDSKGRRLIDRDRCTRCFKCVDACLYGALTVIGETKTPEDILNVVKKDSLFYKNSGGGVTLSGGEALMQPDFLQEVLKLLKQNGLHTALDTTGFASDVVIDKILPMVDLVLLDIKHLDPIIHKRFTGVDNTLISENARHIAIHVKTWFRIPLIRSINDDKEHISRVADMAKSLGVEKVSLLPYHEGGLSKWQQIGKLQPKFSGKAPEEEHIRILEEIISEKGIQVGIRA